VLLPPADSLLIFFFAVAPFGIERVHAGKKHDLSPHGFRGEWICMITPDDSAPEDRVGQLEAALGSLDFVVGSCGKIGRLFPEMKEEADRVLEVYQASPLWESFEPILRELREVLSPEEFEKFNGARALLENPFGDIDIADARHYLSLFEAQAGGIILEGVANILACHPRYADAPGVEMDEGWVEMILTSDIPGSKGIDAFVDVPLSWRAVTRPEEIETHMVFANWNGIGPVWFEVAFMDLPAAGKSISDAMFEDLEANLTERSPEFREVKLIEALNLDSSGKPDTVVWVDCAWIGEFEDGMHVFRNIAIVFARPSGLLVLRFCFDDFSLVEGSLEDLKKKYEEGFLAFAERVCLLEPGERP